MGGPDSPRPRFVEMLAGIAESPRVHADVATAIRVLEEMSTDRRSGPFVSLVVLVPRDRQEALKDTLLCLHAQSVLHFEVVLACQSTSKDELGEIDRIVADQPAELRELIRTVDQTGADRPDALNAAVLAACGSYVVACEAGDMFLAHWASETEQAANGAASRVIHSLGTARDVAPVLWPTDEEGFRSAGAPLAPEGGQCGALEDPRHRQSPPATWAIPRWLFDRFGLWFTAEDSPLASWGLIDRACTIAGVVEPGRVTTVSRTWLTARSWEAVELVPETSAHVVPPPDEVAVQPATSARPKGTGSGPVARVAGLVRPRKRRRG